MSWVLCWLHRQLRFLERFAFLIHLYAVNLKKRMHSIQNFKFCWNAARLPIKILLCLMFPFLKMPISFHAAQIKAVHITVHVLCVQSSQSIDLRNKHLITMTGKPNFRFAICRSCGIIVHSLPHDRKAFSHEHSTGICFVSLIHNHKTRSIHMDAVRLPCSLLSWISWILESLRFPT